MQRNIVQAVSCCFVCRPHVSLGRKENSGKQSRAEGAESKQTSPQLPSLTSIPFFLLYFLPLLCCFFGVTVADSSCSPAAQQSSRSSPRHKSSAVIVQRCR